MGANLIHIASQMSILFFNEGELEDLGRQLGFANFLMLLALQKYLLYEDKYANLPNTLIGSARAVANGLFGILPVAIGIAFYGTTVLYMSHRFRSFSCSMFAMFYTIQGDT